MPNTGILPNGASYLLLPTSVYDAFRRQVPRGVDVDELPTHAAEVKALFKRQAHPPSRFISLSPLTFQTREALVAKLKELAQRPQKNAPDRDRSKANTHYTSNGERIEILTGQGLNRATFEFHRYVSRGNHHWISAALTRKLQNVLSSLSGNGLPV